MQSEHGPWKRIAKTLDMFGNETLSAEWAQKGNEWGVVKPSELPFEERNVMDEHGEVSTVRELLPYNQHVAGYERLAYLLSKRVMNGIVEVPQFDLLKPDAFDPPYSQELPRGISHAIKVKSDSSPIPPERVYGMAPEERRHEFGAAMAFDCWLSVGDTNAGNYIFNGEKIFHIDFERSMNRYGGGELPTLWEADAVEANMARGSGLVARMAGLGQRYTGSDTFNQYLDAVKKNSTHFIRTIENISKIENGDIQECINSIPDEYIPPDDKKRIQRDLTVRKEYIKSLAKDFVQAHDLGEQARLAYESVRELPEKEMLQEELQQKFPHFSWGENVEEQNIQYQQDGSIAFREDGTADFMWIDANGASQAVSFPPEALTYAIDLYSLPYNQFANVSILQKNTGEYVVDRLAQINPYQPSTFDSLQKSIDAQNPQSPLHTVFDAQKQNCLIEYQDGYKTANLTFWPESASPWTVTNIPNEKISVMPINGIFPQILVGQPKFMSVSYVGDKDGTGGYHLHQPIPHNGEIQALPDVNSYQEKKQGNDEIEEENIAKSEKISLENGKNDGNNEKMLSEDVNIITERKERTEKNASSKFKFSLHKNIKGLYPWFQPWRSVSESLSLERGEIHEVKSKKKWGFGKKNVTFLFSNVKGVYKFKVKEKPENEEMIRQLKSSTPDALGSVRLNVDPQGQVRVQDQREPFLVSMDPNERFPIKRSLGFKQITGQNWEITDFKKQEGYSSSGLLLEKEDSDPRIQALFNKFQNQPEKIFFKKKGETFSLISLAATKEEQEFLTLAKGDEGYSVLAQRLQVRSVPGFKGRYVSVPYKDGQKEYRAYFPVGKVAEGLGMPLQTFLRKGPEDGALRINRNEKGQLTYKLISREKKLPTISRGS